MNRLLEVMRRLRAPDGCPWDREQTHESLRPYLLEEAAEAVDAISAGETGEVVQELGDVLLQIAFHAVIAEEGGAYRYEDIEQAIVDKLIRRHPHVFGDVRVADSDEVMANWQEIKRRERAHKPASHPASRVPKSLGALARLSAVAGAAKLPTKTRTEVLEAVARSGEDVQGVADVLEIVVAWARGLGVDAEQLVRERTDLRVLEAERMDILGEPSDEKVVQKDS